MYRFQMAVGEADVAAASEEQAARHSSAAGLRGGTDG